eukprot:scaffold7162_cov210-Pinguiococcus_pyrenoidosus.AAC.1
MNSPFHLFLHSLPKSVLALSRTLWPHEGSASQEDAPLSVPRFSVPEKARLSANLFRPRCDGWLSSWTPSDTLSPARCCLPAARRPCSAPPRKLLRLPWETWSLHGRWPPLSVAPKGLPPPQGSQVLRGPGRLPPATWEGGWEGLDSCRSPVSGPSVVRASGDVAPSFRNAVQRWVWGDRKLSLYQISAAHQSHRAVDFEERRPHKLPEGHLDWRSSAAAEALATRELVLALGREDRASGGFGRVERRVRSALEFCAGKSTGEREQREKGGKGKRAT